MKDRPDITYIVSAYDRPVMLPVCLWSIKGQTHQSFEVIVTDNATDDKIAAQHWFAVHQINDERFKYVRTTGKIAQSDCYHAAQWAISHTAQGTWLCFPCDDTYLVPEFASRLLSAAMANAWDFVYSKHAVSGPVGSAGSGYYVWDAFGPQHNGKPKLMMCKTLFMVRASVFPGFTNSPHADFDFGYTMIARGVRMGYVDEVLLIHN